MSKLLIRENKTFALKADAINGNKMTGDAGGLGNMDSYTDVIFPDAFSEEVIADFLSAGFIADCHDWNKMIGMPLVAEVRGSSLYTECEFHSTDDAQAVKTKCAERIGRSLSVGLSVGIGFYESSTKAFKNGAALLAYAEAQGQDMSLFDVAGIKAHTSACRAIIRVDKWYEYSPVPLPANPNAWATGMKVAPGVSVQPQNPGALLQSSKGEYFSDYAVASMTMAALSRLTESLYYNIFWDCIYYDDEPLQERRAKLAGALAEYMGIVLRTYDAIMAVEESESDEAADSDSENVVAKEEKGDSRGSALLAIKALWSDPKSSSEELPAGSSFHQQLNAALAAVKGCATRAEAVHTLRQKSGRALSPARVAEITAQREELAGCLKSIDDLLVTTSASPEPEPVDASAPSAALTSAVLALRASALRRQNEARQIIAGELI